MVLVCGALLYFLFSRMQSISKVDSQAHIINKVDLNAWLDQEVAEDDSINHPISESAIEGQINESVIEEQKETIDTSPSETESEGDVETPIFESEIIDEELKLAMSGKSYHDNDTIKYEDLRCINVAYYGFDGLTHQGKLIVNQAISDKIITIFKGLYEAQFPIEKIELIDQYDGDDHRSMVANNTSAFNFRTVSGTDRLSNHAYGLAIDINPLINPYVTRDGVSPKEGEIYANRDQEVKGMIHKGDICYNLFIENGFSWGGNWINSKDYQHFDIKIDGINQ